MKNYPFRIVHFYMKPRVSAVFIAEARDCSLIQLFTFTRFGYYFSGSGNHLEVVMLPEK